ncbi:unnamed protein product [Agarophyton chilense]|eukprot:gb/GEZJ01000824.1/.p1 GENE.gb/GEZJ01000824.1/~~gb/GEZJ01000824.1/.p1  ORF type:complete len:755 (-),score=87.26 gb/GEZJ01000824.1/:2106-4370(-)
MGSAETCSLTIDDLYLVDVNRFDIWDRRESAVGNAPIWKTACEAYKASSQFKSGIPLKMHQIWIGSRQPPCVWLDTWRVDFMNKFATSQSAEKHWEYVLWNNENVRDMPMLNRHIFDNESAPQCQADILRLEVLYEYGGVYIDADIVSTQRDLRPALETAKETGFLITYEPDTKDKPYSVLGNSLIACTPKHPLILMLMSYIKQIYGFKRAHYGVEWVTGPLTYTKVLIHPEMPVTIPPSKDFYPAFHYIPNPSAIDVTSFDSYCFQFGYTCSGLSQWVAANNKCRKAHQCKHHANLEYPLGKLRQFPSKHVPIFEDSVIPNIIHQFSFQPEHQRPKRWSGSWQQKFCPATKFKYELWTWDRLKKDIGLFYCANLYRKESMDNDSFKMLVLEVLEKYGGYYAPLTTVFTGDETDPEITEKIFGTGNGGFYERGSVFGAAPNTCALKILEWYNNGYAKASCSSLPSTLVADMKIGDDKAAFAHFKDGSRFLGASRIYYFSPEQEQKSGLSASAAMVWAYDCQVPIFCLGSEEDTITSIREADGRVIVVTDSLFGAFSSVINELPGVMYRFENDRTDWEYIVFNVEWEADCDGFEVYSASCPFRSPTARYLGFIANSKTTKNLSSISIDEILGRFESGKVFVASEKSRHTAKLASIFRTMPSVENACQTLAGYYPSFERDQDEVHGNLFKGLRNGQVAFELQVDDEQRVMYRSWGSSGAIDIECKIQPGMNGLSVEWLRRYMDGHVMHETVGKFLR